MPKCAGCTAGQCSLGVTDTPSLNLTLTGNGSVATPWHLSGVAAGGAGTVKDYFGLNISGLDTDLNEFMSAGTIGYTDLNSFDKLGGAETVNLNPLRPDPGDGVTFSLTAFLVTATYDLEIDIFVSSMDCTEKVKMQKNVVITPADSGGQYDLGAPGSWDINTFGTDLSVASSLGDMLVNSESGLCLISEMLIGWFAA